MTWSLKDVLAAVHDDVQHKLGAVRNSFKHPGTLGDASESVWLEVMQTYLPQRYSVARAHVVDSDDNFSDQIDVVVFDRQYTPFIFHFAGKSIVPAEAVYAVFEAKQTADAAQVAYAEKKVASVRALVRTSLKIPHAGGKYDAKKPGRIVGGLLTLESDWKPAMGDRLRKALSSGKPGQLDIGCVAAHGYFRRNKGGYAFVEGNRPATGFLFALISELQQLATVPMIDVSAYARWLSRSE
jgi:hypothetical protein